MQKILFIHGSLNVGGAERVLLDFLSHLDRKKYEIHLCLIISGGTLSHEIPKDIKVFSLWNSYNFYYRLAYRFSALLGNDYLLKKTLHQKIKDEYDVIISFLEGMPLKLHSLLNYQSKNISWVHTDLDKFRYTEKLFYRKNERAAYDKMDTVACVSKNTGKSFLNRFPGFRKEIAVIYNPVDIQKILALSDVFPVEKSNRFKVVFAGRLTKPKRVDRLLKVAERCKKEGLEIEFQIVGDGELKDGLKKMSDELQLNDSVEFAGYQSNPYPYIKSADVLISVSAYEGFGLVLCEAMALGVPVISTKTAGAVEILDNNHYGLLCEQEEKAIFEAVKSLYENKDLRKAYIGKASERLKDFGVKSVMKTFDELIKN